MRGSYWLFGIDGSQIFGGNGVNHAEPPPAFGGSGSAAEPPPPRTFTGSNVGEPPLIG